LRFCQRSLDFVSSGTAVEGLTRSKATTDSEGDIMMKMHNPLDTDDDGDALQEAEEETAVN
jgi:hypothetical protein